MLEPFRTEFNEKQFSSARYAELLDRMNRRTRSVIDFRICETPCFFPRPLLAEMEQTGRKLLHQLIDNPEYMRLSDTAIPAQYRVPGDSPRPHFAQVDFGLVREEGELRPKLVELQAFPSIYGYQDVLCEETISVYGLDRSLEWRFGGMDSESYWRASTRDHRRRA